MTLSKISIEKPVLMSMAIGAFMVFGLVAFLKLPIDLTPNVEFPFVTVQTVYMGAGPEEIETSVIKPIEEQLSTVSNVKNITAMCAEGLGFIFVEFNIGTDPDLAAIDVKDKIDAILYTLPRDLLKPVVGKFDINAQPILNLAVTGPQTPEDLRDITEKQVKEQLAKIPGVASISITGGREREIQVNLHKEKIDALNLAIPQVAGIIAAQTANLPGGHVSGDLQEYTVRVQGQFSSLDEIRNLKIPVASGGSGGGSKVAWVPLSSIADVADTYKEVREGARYNSENTVGLGILKRSDANTVQIATKVRRAIVEIEKDLPKGTKIGVAQDRASFIESSVADMYRNIAIGIVLTALMLFIFLGDWRLAVIAAVTIPGSVIITFLGMQLFDFTINMMTLIAIGISIGTLVTNAIIVLENISRHRNEGMAVRQASEFGATEVFVAVLASALTNVAVFVPLANMGGIVGQMFRPLGITITVATLVSLTLSITLVPMMASRMLKSRRHSGESLADKWLRPVQSLYVKALKVTLRFRIALVVGVALLFIASMRMMGTLGSEFFPQMDNGFINVDLQMPSGASLNATDRVLKTMEQRLFTVPEVEKVYSSLGGTGSQTGINYGGLTVTLKDRKQRTRTTAEVISQIRPMMADLPDAKIVVRTVSMFGGHSSADVQVEVTGDDMHELLALAETVRQKALQVQGLVDVKITWEAAKPEIKFIPDRQRLDEYGVQVSSLGFALRSAMSGYEAAVYREENDEYKIRVQLAGNDRNTIDAVENITIPTQKGMVPIKALAKIVYEGGAASIQRKNRQRLVYVEANVGQGTTGIKARELKALTDQIAVPSGYGVHFGGEQEMQGEAMGEMMTATGLAIIITYMVLAGSIESLIMPVLIMLTLPLGLVGIVWALVLTGTSISMISLMSMIMLIGVVVNNAILLVDYANIKRREGMTPFDAIVEACRTKFVAIIMMNLAIVISSIPQALATGTMSSPFAITAIGGVVVSTAMTYFVVPAFYLFSARTRKKPAAD